MSCGVFRQYLYVSENVPPVYRDKGGFTGAFFTETNFRVVFAFLGNAITFYRVRSTAPAFVSFLGQSRIFSVGFCIGRDDTIGYNLTTNTTPRYRINYENGDVFAKRRVVTIIGTVAGGRVRNRVAAAK